MKKYFLFFFYISFTVFIYAQETTINKSLLSQPASTGNINYLPHLWNESIGSSEINITRSHSGESLMGNFICDAMLSHTEADFAFISYGELYSDLYKGNITRLDMFRLVPFDRTLVVLEISGDTLKQIIEKSFGGVSSGLAIAGGKVEYDLNRPAQNRLTFVQVNDSPLYPKKEYRVVTIDYLAAGSAGFDLLRGFDQTRMFRTGTLLRDILIDHIIKQSPLDRSNVSIDNRWIAK